MGYSIEDIRREVNAAMQSGEYPVASLEMFDIVDNLRLSTKVHDHLSYTHELLMEHLEEINKLDGQVPSLTNYLNTLKAGDVIDNQSLEKENSFLVGLYMQISRETAIDKLINLYKNSEGMTPEELKSIALTLVTGTSSEKKQIIRDCNDKYVGRFVNGERKIDYFPVDYQCVDTALDKLSEFYNRRIETDTYDNVLIQPFVLHGLIGALQVFGDGNTRIGRLLQHSLIWQLINEKTEYNFDNPPLYATRAYYPMRCEYRDLIANLVKENNEEAWNQWVEFNLKRIEDQIYKNGENIIELKRRRKSI